MNPKEVSIPKPKGSPKTGGRQAGTSNKRTYSAIKTLEELKLDPLAELSKMALEPSLDFNLRANILKELCHYAYPKHKAVSLDESEEREISKLSDDELKEFLRSTIADLDD